MTDIAGIALSNCTWESEFVFAAAFKTMNLKEAITLFCCLPLDDTGHVLVCELRSHNQVRQ